MIMLVGPTAVGKTQLAIGIAEKLKAQIISIDSRQIYKYMDIGTAKPSLEERERVKHHLIDFVEPNEDYNVYLFVRDVIRVMSSLRDTPVLFVGGSGLYVDALTKGILEGVPADKDLRQRLQRMETEEPGTLRKKLLEVDPESARRIHPNDLKRTVRALEVWYKTHKRISDLQKRVKPVAHFKLIYLLRDRDELYDRINKRVDSMLKRGLVEEVESILKRGYSEDLNSLKTIGYQETISYLKGKISYAEMVELIKRNTRHFARRQIMWFNRYSDAVRVNLSECGCSEVTNMVEKYMNKKAC